MIGAKMNKINPIKTLCENCYKTKLNKSKDDKRKCSMYRRWARNNLQRHNKADCSNHFSFDEFCIEVVDNLKETYKEHFSFKMVDYEIGDRYKELKH